MERLKLLANVSVPRLHHLLLVVLIVRAAHFQLHNLHVFQGPWISKID